MYYLRTFSLVIFTSLFWSKQVVAQKNSNLSTLVASFNEAPKEYDYTQLVSSFEKLPVSPNETKDWLPSYYLSLLYTRLSFQAKKGGDLYADKAIFLAQQSMAIQTNDENYCALSMAYTAKMAVSPYMRWLSYEKSIYEPLQKAKKINTNNPRIYILEASLQMNIPSIFGGGCAKSKTILVKAKQLLDKQVPSTTLPTWGKLSLDDFRETCPF